MTRRRPPRRRAPRPPRPSGSASPARLSWWLPSGAARQQAYELALDDGRTAPARLGPQRPRAVAVRTARLAAGGSLAGSGLDRPRRVGLVGAGDDRGRPARAGRLVGGVDRARRGRAPAAGRAPGLAAAPRSSCSTTPAAARLYATAHGIYEAFLNGQRVGDLELTPGFTSYAAHLHVQTYDVTDLLVAGTNTLGGDAERRLVPGPPRQRAASPTGSATPWRSSGSSRSAAPRRRRPARTGRRRPARSCAPTSWPARSRTDASSRPAGEPVARRPTTASPQLTGSPAPPIRRVRSSVRRSVDAARRRPPGRRPRPEHQRLAPARTTSARPAPSSSCATVRPSTPHGDVTTDAPRVRRHPARAGRPGRLRRAAGRRLRAPPHRPRLPVRPGRGPPAAARRPRRRPASSCTPTSAAPGWFRCSDERLNRLHEIADWSFRGNACDIPTDCPHRERSGWTGDWQVFLPTAAFLYDVAGFSVKWLRDLAAEQLPDGLLPNYAPDPRRRAGPGPAT